MNYPLTIVLSLSLIVSAFAQEPGVRGKRGERRPQQEKAIDSDGEGKSDENAVLVDPHAPRGGARGYAIFSTSVQPRRIAPGGSGKVVLTMILQKEFVMTSPANLGFEFAPEQGFITLGQPSIRPATLGSLPTFFKGQAVYDDVAIIDVPIFVAANAPFRNHQVSIRTLFDITNGRTGQFFQRFMESASTQVEVGEAIPENLRPDLAGGGSPQPGAAGASAPADPPRGPEGMAPESAGAAVEPAEVSGGKLLPVPANSRDVGGVPAGSGTAPVPEPATSYGLLAAAGGFVLLMLGLLLAKRR